MYIPAIYFYVSEGGFFRRQFEDLIFDVQNLDGRILGIYSEFLVGKIRSTIGSEPDFASEIFFWKRFLRKGEIVGRRIEAARLQDVNETVISCYEELVDVFGGALNLLDIGCGPFSRFFIKELIEDPLVTISAVDPLADVYTELHEQHNTGYGIDCVQGFGENLSDIFPDGHFHMAYSKNALDHSQDPGRFVEEATKVLKPGGLLMLQGYVKEGTRSRWTGLHKWNIDIEGDDMTITNKKGRTWNITRGLPLEAVDVSATGVKAGDRFTTVYRKTGI